MTWFVLSFIILGGAVLLIFGVKHLRQAAVVGRIPETPVRDISNGVVQVFGRIEGDDPLISPLTGVPCYHYHARAEYLSAGERASWSERDRAIAQRDFYVNDGTARVRVVPEGASLFELTETMNAEINAEEEGSTCRVNPSLNLPQPTEERLRGLVLTDWKQPTVPGVGFPTAPVEEWKEKKKWWAPAAEKVIGAVVEEMVGLERTEIQRFRLTETCLVAGQEYSVIGTCVQEEGTDAKAIRRGTAEKTFMISAKRGRTLVSKLRKQGLLMVACGVALILFVVFFGDRMKPVEEEGHEPPAAATQSER